METASKEAFRIAKKVWDKVFGQVYIVESMDYARKREGIRYETKHSGSDEWSCDCPSYKFESGTSAVRDAVTGKRYERTCKHIRFCMEKEGMKFKRAY